MVEIEWTTIVATLFAYLFYCLKNYVVLLMNNLLYLLFYCEQFDVLVVRNLKN
jgi:hypothetical protein